MPVSVTQSIKASASTHSWIPLNVYEDDSQVGVVFSTPAGDWAGTIQGTLDNVLAGVSALSFTLMTIAGSGATVYTSAFSRPLRAIRFDCTEGSGASPASFRVLQTGK